MFQPIQRVRFEKNFKNSNLNYVGKTKQNEIRDSRCEMRNIFLRSKYRLRFGFVLFCLSTYNNHNEFSFSFFSAHIIFILPYSSE